MGEPSKMTQRINKGLLMNAELYQYILETSVYPREAKPLKEIREVTAALPRALMATAPDAGQALEMLLKLVNAKKTIEIGVFTGYSLLLTALSLPEDGKIIAIDADRENYEIGLPIIKKVGVEHKIDFIESQALPVLDKLLEDQENEGSFDFAFVDADKVNYQNYHARLMKLLKVGGLAVYDNTLWLGTVALPEDLAENLVGEIKAVRQATIKFNEFLTADSRIQICMAPLGDGLTICRNYHERLMKLLKVGGLAVYDNTLWLGTVALPEDLADNLVGFVKEKRKHVIELNEFLAADSRIEICMAPIGDGLTICRRLY